jgi:hypothetical protein
MDRWKQYGGLAGLFAVCLAAGLWGFSSTGGALPWAKRSAQALQRGARAGGGALVDVGRGVVVAGPIREGGLLFEYLAVVVLLVGVGVAVYVYVDRYRGRDDGNRAARRS